MKIIISFNCFEKHPKKEGKKRKERKRGRKKKKRKKEKEEKKLVSLFWIFLQKTEFKQEEKRKLEGV